MNAATVQLTFLLEVRLRQLDHDTIMTDDMNR